MSEPVRLSGLLGDGPGYGAPLERIRKHFLECFEEGERRGCLKRWKRDCQSCGSEYVQNRISQAYLDRLGEHRPGAVAALLSEFPERWILTRCPRCERRRWDIAPSFHNVQPGYYSRNPGDGVTDAWMFGAKD